MTAIIPDQSIVSEFLYAIDDVLLIIEPLQMFIMIRLHISQYISYLPLYNILQS